MSREQPTRLQDDRRQTAVFDEAAMQDPAAAIDHSEQVLAGAADALHPAGREAADTARPDGAAGGLELRVLDGRQGGARAALQPGMSCVLAALPGDGPDDADIVLREHAGTPVRVRITPGRPHAQIEVLQGEVELSGQVFAAGALALWAMRTPLRVGSARVAFGPVGAGEWSEAAMAAAGAGAPADMPPIAPPAARPRGLAYWFGVGGAVLLFTSAGALAVAHVAANREPMAAPVPFGDALRASEFAHLRIEQDEQGAAVLRGRLETLAQRTRLDNWLFGRPGAPRVQVEVEEQLARDVADVFRVNGVAVRTRSSGPAQIVAEATEPDPQRLARAEEVVRRDVRGLGTLTVHNLAAPPVPPAPPVVDDPGKRIASIVTGDPAYLVTVDGSRYFVGAMLPTGHRITAIEDQRVSLELNGRSTQLDF